MATGAIAALLCTIWIAAAAAGPAGGPNADARAGGSPEFRGGVAKLDHRLRKRMKGRSWHRGCPVGLVRLRLVRARHWNFGMKPRMGMLVVHERYAGGMLKVMKRLWAKRFPIRRMKLIDRYGADDRRSMAHDNTSAFNCRFVAGTSRWSMHAYGKAIDINPRENPYVSGGHVSPPEGRPYAKRKPKRRGMIFRKGPAVGSMKRIIDWRWGGDWTGPTDYQHLSSDGT